MKVYSNDKFSVSTSCEEAYRGIIYVTNKETNWQYQLRVHQDWISSLNLLADHCLVTGSIDGTVAATNLDEGKVEILTSINRPISCMGVKYLGTILIGSEEGVITVLNLFNPFMRGQGCELGIEDIIHEIDTGLGPILNIEGIDKPDSIVVETTHTHTKGSWDITQVVNEYAARLEVQVKSYREDY